MQRATFKIKCISPEIVAKAVNLEEKENAQFNVDGETLVVEISAESLKELMKVSYSICNRIQLSIDTLDALKSKD
ncbi:hypothetical protein ENBRE01_0220 [Enteropsectra breve]|nr:hypothetical protein ENBRE01_0220 [Enteropsectra breve]